MKIELTKIDKENWRFVLYETKNGEWIADFVYSPKSFVDLSMLIKLTKDEKLKAENDRSNLIALADRIRNNFEDYISRAENRKSYSFKK